MISTWGKKLIITIPILISLIFAFLTHDIVKASTIQKEPDSTSVISSCFSLDLVFIIDQSSSMGGDNNAPANDPTGQRGYGPKWAIDWLTDNALDICPDAFHRVAVISFGGKSQVDLPLSNINPQNTNEWSYLRKTLKENVQVLNLGETDPKRAFSDAIRILDQAGSIGNAPRKRVIIYMTDGMPCVPDMGCVKPNPTMDFVQYAKEMQEQIDKNLPFDATLFKQEACLQAARDTYGRDNIPAEVSNKCLEDYRVSVDQYQRSTYIWTMLLSFGQAWPKQLKDIYTEISRSHGGDVIDITQNRGDIPANFLNIMTQLAGVPVTRLSCGNFAVNPYVRQARMTFFKLSEDTKVILSYTDASGASHEISTDAQGVRHELKNGEPGSGGFDVNEQYSEGANERYVFDNPYPGIWRIESDACQGIDAYYEPIQMEVSGGSSPVQLYNPVIGNIAPENGNLPEYDQEPFFNQQRPYYIAYQMRDQEGNIVSNVGSSFFNVKFDIKVTGPGNQIASYNDVEWLEQEKEFKTKEPLKLQTPGEYTISLSGSIPYRNLPYGPVDGTPETVFDQKLDLFHYDNVKFKVFEVTPFKLEVMTPEENKSYQPIHGTILDGWPLPVKPFEVRARLLENGQPVTDVNSIFPNTNDVFNVYLKQNDLQSDQISMTPDPGKPGEYIGKIENFNNVESVPVKAVVELSNTYSDHYRPDGNSQVTVSFNRVDGIFNREITYKIILGLMIALIVIKIIICIINSRYPLRGSIIFEAAGIDSLPLSAAGKLCSRNQVLYMRPFKQHSDLDVFAMRLDSIPKKYKKQDDDDGDSSASIRVRLCLLSKTTPFRRFIYPIFPALIEWHMECVLMEQGAQGYSDVSLATIKYEL